MNREICFPQPPLHRQYNQRGKILRRSIRQIARGEDYNIPSTIDDPGSLPEIEEILRDAGIGKKG